MTITASAAKKKLEAQAQVLRDVVDEQLRIRAAVLPVATDIKAGRMTDRAGELARLRDAHRPALDAGEAKAKAAAAAAQEIAADALSSPSASAGSVEQRLLAEVTAGRYWDRTRGVLDGLDVWSAATYIADQVRSASPDDRSTLLTEVEPYLRGRIGQARRASDASGLTLPARDGTSVPALSSPDATADIDRLMAEVRAAVGDADPELGKVQELADEITSAARNEVGWNVWRLGEWIDGGPTPFATSKPGMTGDLQLLPDTLAA